MTSIGASELLLIFLIAAIVIGPQNARTMMKAIRKWTNMFKRFMEEIKKEAGITEEVENIKREISEVSGESTIEGGVAEVKKELASVEKNL